MQVKPIHSYFRSPTRWDCETAVAEFLGSISYNTLESLQYDQMLDQIHVRFISLYNKEMPNWFIIPSKEKLLEVCIKIYLFVAGVIRIAVHILFFCNF